MDLQLKHKKLKNVKATTWIWLRWYMASTHSVNRLTMARRYRIGYMTLGVL